MSAYAMTPSNSTKIRLPCIDAGSNAAVPAGMGTDLAGNPRFVDDAGAPDCAVNIVDFLTLLAHWGPC